LAVVGFVREDPDSCPPKVYSSVSCVHSIGGESPGRCSVEVRISPRLASFSSVFRTICAALGTPQIDFFASKASSQTCRFFSWNALDRPEAVDALSQVWDFDLAYAFPPVLLLRQVAKKLESSRGVFLLVTLFWEAQLWFPYILTLNVIFVRRLSFSTDLLLDLTTGSPPPILKNLQLVVWRILGGAGISPCPTTPLL
jgi:hypothetical protein